MLSLHELCITSPTASSITAPGPVACNHVFRAHLSTAHVNLLHRLNNLYLPGESTEAAGMAEQVRAYERSSPLSGSGLEEPKNEAVQFNVLQAANPE